MQTSGNSLFVNYDLILSNEKAYSPILIELLKALKENPFMTLKIFFERQSAHSIQALATMVAASRGDTDNCGIGKDEAIMNLILMTTALVRAEGVYTDDIADEQMSHAKELEFFSYFCNLIIIESLFHKGLVIVYRNAYTFDAQDDNATICELRAK